MAVSTIRSKSNPVLEYLPYIIGAIGILLVVYFSFQIISNLDNLKGKAALEVNCSNSTADVYINDIKVGQTPYTSNTITPGDNKITLKNETRQYETTLNSIASTKAYMYGAGIFRDLGISDYFSSGQDVWFEKDKSGNVLRVVTEPSGASVYIDNEEQGKTPISSDKLSEGEYTLRVDYPGYEYQEIRIKIIKDNVLNVRAKLFPSPVPATVNLLQDSNNFFDLTTANNNLISDTHAWAKAVLYWNKTRGINLAGVGVNKEQVFDYFLDYKGNIFDKAGEPLLGEENLSKLADSKNGAYLGRSSDPSGLTPEAKTAYLSMTAAGLGGKQATVLETGTGWLRVRDDPSLIGKELVRVNVGQQYSVIEEKTGWVKIKVSDTVQGWVSSDYVKVK